MLETRTGPHLPWHWDAKTLFKNSYLVEWLWRTENGRVRTIKTTKEVQRRVTDRLASPKSLAHLEYPKEEVTEEDKIVVERIYNTNTSMRNALLKAVCSMLAAIGKINLGSNLYTKFTEEKESQQLTTPFMSDLLLTMPKGKHYCFMDMGFPFMLCFRTDTLKCQKEICWHLCIHCT